MKNPKNMATDELIELADEIKRGIAGNFLKDAERFRKADKLKAKKTISKKEAIIIADRVKSGMSIKVMNGLEKIKKAGSKPLLAQ